MRTFKGILWTWALRQMRAVVWMADEWIHAQELKLREPIPAAPVAPPVEFNQKASAAREKMFRKTVARTPRPRLIYKSGQFVRQDAPRWTDSQRELAQN
jgi:hypothetical protein